MMERTIDALTEIRRNLESMADCIGLLIAEIGPECGLESPETAKPIPMPQPDEIGRQNEIIDRGSDFKCPRYPGGLTLSLGGKK